MDLQTAIEHLLNGNTVLFVGAGFSVDAQNLNNEPVKTADQLRRKWGAEIDYPTESRLEDVAEAYLDEFGADKFLEDLHNEFSITQVQDFHRCISTQPWRRIYTTNFDNVLEVANPAVIPISLSDNVSEISKNSKTAIHFNGYIKRLNLKSIRSELRLTDTSYATSSLTDSPWAAFFRQDLSIARAIFFVGYSLADLDIKRVLIESDTLKEKTFFIIGPNPDQATVRAANKYGNALRMTAKEFAEIVINTAETYLPLELPDQFFYCLEKFEPIASPTTARDADIFNLLLYGDFKANLIAESLFRTPGYYIKRKELDNVFRHLERGRKAVVLYSDIANGKSLFIEGIKHLAYEKGFNVYSFINHGTEEEMLDELDYLCRSNDKILLIIERYPDWLDEIDFLASQPNSHISLVLTARTSPNDLLIDRLLEKLDLSSLPEIPLDKLQNGDVDQLIELLNRHGLWGENSHWSHERKQDFIQHECRREFHAVLLKLFKSPDIVQRFALVVEQLNDRRDFYEIILAILSFTVLGYRVTFELLANAVGDVVFSTQFRRDPVLNSLIDERGGTIRFRSSVAAQFILTSISNPIATVDVLARIAKQLESKRYIQLQYDQIFKSLMRFSRIQELLPEKGRRESVIRYYEGIKNLESCRTYPLFWLQYAIATLTFNEFERSERYFGTAYSLAEKRNFNTFQIDNHYARFLLARAINERNPDNCMTAFRKARRIINGEVRSERRHYAYRVASFYEDFYEVFSKILNEKDLTEIGLASKFIREQIEKLPPARRRHPSVLKCESAMDYILLSLQDAGISLE